MKKILALLVVTVLLLTALTACGSKSSSITIAVPNDATNEARALLLLQDNGYIKLKDGAGITATINDIAENPKNITFNEVGAAQVPNVPFLYQGEECQNLFSRHNETKNFRLM